MRFIRKRLSFPRTLASDRWCSPKAATTTVLGRVSHCPICSHGPLLPPCRLRGAARHDRLAAALFPYDSTTSRPYELGLELLAKQHAAIQAGTCAPAPGSTLVPTEATPLFTRGMLVDRAIDEELLATLHAMRHWVARWSPPWPAGGQPGCVFAATIDNTKTNNVQLLY